MFHKYGKLFPTRIILFILCHKYIQPWLRYFSRNIWHCCISIYYHPLIISCSGIGNQCSVGKPKVVGITRRNTVSVLSYTFQLRCYIIQWPLINRYGDDGVNSNIKLVIISLWLIRFGQSNWYYHGNIEKKHWNHIPCCICMVVDITFISIIGLSISLKSKFMTLPSSSITTWRHKELYGQL